MELPAERIRRDGRSLALIPGQAAPTRLGTQSLGMHQPLDAMQAAIDAFRQHIAPDTPGTVGPIRTKEACPDPGANLLVVACTLARRPADQAWKPERDTSSASQSHATGQIPRCFAGDTIVFKERWFRNVRPSGGR